MIPAICTQYDPAKRVVDQLEKTDETVVQALCDGVEVRYQRVAFIPVQIGIKCYQLELYRWSSLDVRFASLPCMFRIRGLEESEESAEEVALAAIDAKMRALYTHNVSARPRAATRSPTF